MTVRRADQADQLAVVGRDEHGRSAGVDLTEQVHDLEREIGIEVARRFVREHERRIVDQRTRDGDALLFAAGEIARIRVDAVLQARPT